MNQEINQTMKEMTMRAIILSQYGSPGNLHVRDIPRPEPAENELLVEVYASTVTTADTQMRRADPFISRFFLGFFRPRKNVVGTGFAGRIVSVGRGVKRFKAGDAVFGETGTDFGANAEYLSLSEDAVVLHKPAGLSFEEAATLTDGPLTSYNFLRQLGKLEAGQRVLINGASGSLGTAAVQIAKYYGAEVTGVASGRNEELVKGLGADHFMDYTQTDITKTGQTYHLIFDTVGKLSYGQIKDSLTQQGVFLSPVLGMGMLISMLGTSRSKGKKAVFSATGLLPPDKLREYLGELLKVVDAGQLNVVIDKRFSLEHVADAHAYVDSGRKRGNVVIDVQNPSPIKATG